VSARLDPMAGDPAPPDRLVDVPRLITAYYSEKPDPAVSAQRVAFGTSGHRGISFESSFNETHVLAIHPGDLQLPQAARHRRTAVPRCRHSRAVRARVASALEVLAANGVEVMASAGDEYTPTPAISHAILTHNRGRTASGLADGIVITPSHNPPDSGGFKYNPPMADPPTPK